VAVKACWDLAIPIYSTFSKCVLGNILLTFVHMQVDQDLLACVMMRVNASSQSVISILPYILYTVHWATTIFLDFFDKRSYLYHK
jgi:hypothetical protein